MTGPDFLTQQEEKELSKIVELDVDASIESKHIHEVDVEPPIDSDDL